VVGYSQSRGLGNIRMPRSVQREAIEGNEIFHPALPYIYCVIPTIIIPFCVLTEVIGSGSDCETLAGVRRGAHFGEEDINCCLILSAKSLCNAVGRGRLP
jgi:hypothetical protein